MVVGAGLRLYYELPQLGLEVAAPSAVTTFCRLDSPQQKPLLLLQPRGPWSGMLQHAAAPIRKPRFRRLP